MDLIEEKLEQAQLGCSFFRSLEKGQEERQEIGLEIGQKEATLYLLFCGEEEALEKQAVELLDSLLTQGQAERAVLLSTDPLLSVPHQRARVEVISPEMVENLLCFYELYQFSERFLILSLSRPYGARLQNLLALGYEKEQVFRHCIFQLKEAED